MREVIHAPALAARIPATLRALEAIPGAFDGATTGHLAFLGHRPVEIVLTSSPATYRTLAPGALRGLAVTLALWEEFLGRSDRPIAAPPWERVLDGSRKTLAACAARETVLRSWRLGSREKGGGRTRMVVGPEPHRSLDDRSRLVGRLLLDDDGRAILLEGYPSGADRVFPAPLSGVGERPTDARPDVRSGALTTEFLERYLKRYRERRAALGR